VVRRRERCSLSSPPSKPVVPLSSARDIVAGVSAERVFAAEAPSAHCLARRRSSRCFAFREGIVYVTEMRCSLITVDVDLQGETPRAMTPATIPWGHLRALPKRWSSPAPAKMDPHGNGCQRDATRWLDRLRLTFKQKRDSCETPLNVIKIRPALSKTPSARRRPYRKRVSSLRGPGIRFKPLVWQRAVGRRSRSKPPPTCTLSRRRPRECDLARSRRAADFPAVPARDIVAIVSSTFVVFRSPSQQIFPSPRGSNQPPSPRSACHSPRRQE